MRQLRAEDARFVYAETGHANSNITLVYIYDPSTARAGECASRACSSTSRAACTCPRSSARSCCACRSISTTPTGSRTSASISSTTCATSRCRGPATGASSASRPRASTPDRSTSRVPLGTVPRRGPGHVPGPAGRQLRDPHQDPPRRDRREGRRGDHHAPARHHAAAAAPEPPEPWFPESRPVRCRCSRARQCTTSCSRSCWRRRSRAPCGAWLRRCSARSANCGCTRAAADHALQRRGLAPPGVRDAAVHPRRVPPHPGAGTGCHDQRRGTGRLRRRAAALPADPRRTAGPSLVRSRRCRSETPTRAQAARRASVSCACRSVRKSRTPWSASMRCTRTPRARRT